LWTQIYWYQWWIQIVHELKHNFDCAWLKALELWMRSSIQAFITAHSVGHVKIATRTITELLLGQINEKHQTFCIMDSESFYLLLCTLARVKNTTSWISLLRKKTITDFLWHFSWFFFQTQNLKPFLLLLPHKPWWQSMKDIPLNFYSIFEFVEWVEAEKRLVPWFSYRWVVLKTTENRRYH